MLSNLWASCGQYLLLRDRAWIGCVDALIVITTLMYAIEAGFTAAAGTRLSHQKILLNSLKCTHTELKRVPKITKQNS